jgi:anti-sigma B factor antagonist
MHAHPWLPQPASTTLTFATVCDGPARVRLVLAGEIDMITAGQVVAAVTDTVRLHGPRQIEVDLAGVRFMDSSGIHAFAESHHHAAASDCHLVVTHPQPIVYRILEITNLLHILAVPPDHAGPALPPQGDDVR